MRILITFYYLNNLGGIINNQEGLVAGLRELGHDVTTKLLVWKDSIKTSKSARSLEQETGAMGMRFDQELGWTWPAGARFPYKGKHNIRRWREFASRFDLIIWQIPVPTTQKGNQGNHDWLELYDVPVKQIVYTHDGNLRDGYPWLYAVLPHLTGAVGVHPCAYHGLADLPLPRAMAFSAQQNVAERVARARASREPRGGWFSLQTFKGWKHVDDLVRAVPHMRNSEQMNLAGGGLHYYYMTSQDKLRENYRVAPERDPDIASEWHGQRIWDVAEAHGMEYIGYITNARRDELMLQHKLLIDPSWSRGYAKVGDHFNRTSVEGIIGGALPVARNLGVSTREDGVGEFFRPLENYVMIPYDATPRHFAEIVDDALSWPASLREEMVERGRTEILPHFEAVRSAQTFVDMAEGRPAGVYRRESDRGRHCPEMEAESRRVLREFFGAPPAAATEEAA
jgi:glycosyltransferase involved in cell wall biosynthesis